MDSSPPDEREEYFPPTIEPKVKRRKIGRPKGSKNKATILNDLVKAQFDTVLVERFPELLQKTLELADMGNPTCLKILWDRLLPAKKIAKEPNEGFQSGVSITINAIPGPDGGPGVTILGEKTHEQKKPNTASDPGEHVLRKVPSETTGTIVETGDANSSEIWQERED